MAIGTYYLKYRPQTLSELDSVAVRQELAKVLTSDRLPHAFLFSGPKGIGKTSAARILAKTINCLHKTKNQEPCNQCDICREIINGSALDLIEVDAASNRGIDDIRNLREKIKLSPAKCKYKVYIIDEVHMLTTEAFNALLKTLEEPPEHAIFVLCTTEPEKLPATIISRCLRFNFQKARPEEIISGALRRAVAGEKLELGKGVLELIAHAADGSFRDAHKILEQLSFGGQKVTLLVAQKLLGQLEETNPRRLLQFLVAGDMTAGLAEIDRIVNLGADLSIYTLNILEELRNLLLAKIGLPSVEVNQDLLTALPKTSVIRLIELFSQAASQIKDSPIPQLPLELVVVEWGEGKTRNSKPETRNIPEEKTEKIDLPPARPDLAAAPSVANDGQSASLGASLGGPATLSVVEGKWLDLLAQVRPQNHSVEALLRASRPVGLEGEVLTLEVFYKFHKEKLETEKCRQIVEESASQILGKPVRLKCVLGQKKSLDQVQAKVVVENTPPGSDIIDLANQIFNGKLVS